MLDRRRFQQSMPLKDRLAAFAEDVARRPHDWSPAPSKRNCSSRRGRPILRSIGSICRGCGPNEGQAGTPGEAAQRCSRMCNVSRLAVDEKKRELFADLAAHLTILADEVERVVGPPRPQYLSRTGRFQAKFVEPRHSVPATRPGKSLPQSPSLLTLYFRLVVQDRGQQ